MELFAITTTTSTAAAVEVVVVIAKSSIDGNARDTPYFIVKMEIFFQ